MLRVSSGCVDVDMLPVGCPFGLPRSLLRFVRRQAGSIGWSSMHPIHSLSMRFSLSLSVALSLSLSLSLSLHLSYVCCWLSPVIVFTLSLFVSLCVFSLSLFLSLGVCVCVCFMQMSSFRSLRSGFLAKPPGSRCQCVGPNSPFPHRSGGSDQRQ